MTPDEYSFEPGQDRSPSGLKPHGAETTLRSERLQIERKTFLFALKENPRGRFLRITEGVGARRDAIIIPAPGLEDFLRVLQSMLGELQATAVLTAPTTSTG